MIRCHNTIQCSICEFYGCEADCALFAPPSNADRIRSMSDEELADFLCDVASKTGCFGECIAMPYCYTEHNGMIDWLKQPWEDSHD